MLEKAHPESPTTPPVVLNYETPTAPGRSSIELFMGSAAVSYAVLAMILVSMAVAFTRSHIGAAERIVAGAVGGVGSTFIVYAAVYPGARYTPKERASVRAGILAAFVGWLALFAMALVVLH